MQNPSKNQLRHRFKTLSKVLCVSLLALASPLLQAQEYPSRPINLVVGYPPGGSNDIVARLVAPLLAKELNANVIVENRAGANGTIGAGYVVRANPDGYTLLFSSASPLVLAPQTITPKPFNTVSDFKAVNMVGMTPEAITVGPKTPIDSLTDLLEKAKTQEFSFASAGTGGLPHLTIEMLKQASQGKILHVPYKGGAPAIADALAGHVDGVVQDLTPLYPFIKDGQLKALAITSKDKIGFLPNIPTANTALPDFEVVNWLGIFAPAKTPDAVVDKLNTAIQVIINKPEFQSQLEKIAVIPSTLPKPADFQSFLGNEYERWGKIIKEVGLDTPKS